MAPVEPWAAMDWAAKEVVLANIQKRFHQRWEKGRRKYQSDELGFQGDPLTHALEEAYDLVIYLEYLVRERESAGSRQTLLDLNGFNPNIQKYPGQPVKVSILDGEPAYITAPDGDCQA